MYHSPGRRNGVTVIEVLFASAIAVFGLIGIASLISVAGRQASQANELTQAQAMGNGWYSDFKVRGYDNPGMWLWWNDQTRTSLLFNNGVGVPSATTVNSMRTSNRHAVCIDPIFFADATNAASLLSMPNGTGQAYRPGLFPYYQDNYNPTSNPYSPAFLSVDLPRLLRVSIWNGSSTTSPMSIANDLAFRFFSSSDDLALDVEKGDSSKPATRIGDGSRFSAKGEFSWFATLSPREFLPMDVDTMMSASATSETEYTMSVVITRRRDRQIYSPTSVEAESIPQGERVLTVTPTGVSPVGDFVGGSGGRVQLSASTGISNKMRIGDWVMLAKHQDVTVPAPPRVSLGRATVVRWYRIIGMDAEPTLTASTWSRNVVLDGPDWVFDSTTAGNATQATLVNGVITVFERVIRLPL